MYGSFSKKAFFSVALLAFIFSGGVSASDEKAVSKVVVGEHTGFATIVTLSGVNSDHATVTFRRELDDLAEYCSRNMALGEPGGADAAKVAKCAQEGLSEEGGKIYTRQASCPRNKISMEFGTYTLVAWEKQPDTTIDGKKYRAVRTGWKDDKTGEIVGNCSACNTAQLIDAFEVLCPAKYKALFGDYDPY